MKALITDNKRLFLDPANITQHEEIQDDHPITGQKHIGKFFKCSITDESLQPATKCACRVLKMSEPQYFLFFISEVNLLHSIIHPNIIKLRGCYVSTGEKTEDIEGLIYYDYYESFSIDKLINDENKGFKINLDTRLKIFRQIVSVYTFLNQNRIYHSRILYRNMLLTHNYDVIVTDFGHNSFFVKDTSHSTPKENKNTCFSSVSHKDWFQRDFEELEKLFNLLIFKQERGNNYNYDQDLIGIPLLKWYIEIFGSNNNNIRIRIMDKNAIYSINNFSDFTLPFLSNQEANMLQKIIRKPSLSALHTLTKKIELIQLEKRLMVHRSKIYPLQSAQLIRRTAINSNFSVVSFPILDQISILYESKRNGLEKDSHALFLMGYNLFYGIGIQQDQSAALAYMYKAMEQNHKFASFFLGYYFFQKYCCRCPDKNSDNSKNIFMISNMGEYEEKEYQIPMYHKFSIIILEYWIDGLEQKRSIKYKYVSEYNGYEKRSPEINILGNKYFEISANESFHIILIDGNKEYITEKFEITKKCNDNYFEKVYQLKIEGNGPEDRKVVISISPLTYLPFVTLPFYEIHKMVFILILTILSFTTKKWHCSKDEYIFLRIEEKEKSYSIQFPKGIISSPILILYKTIYNLKWDKDCPKKLLEFLKVSIKKKENEDNSIISLLFETRHLLLVDQEGMDDFNNFCEMYLNSPMFYIVSYDIDKYYKHIAAKFLKKAMDLTLAQYKFPNLGLVYLLPSQNDRNTLKCPNDYLNWLRTKPNNIAVIQAKVSNNDAVISKFKEFHENDLSYLGSTSEHFNYAYLLFRQNNPNCVEIFEQIMEKMSITKYLLGVIYYEGYLHNTDCFKAANLFLQLFKEIHDDSINPSILFDRFSFPEESFIKSQYPFKALPTKITIKQSSPKPNPNQYASTLQSQSNITTSNTQKTYKVIHWTETSEGTNPFAYKDIYLEYTQQIENVDEKIPQFLEKNGDKMFNGILYHCFEKSNHHYNSCEIKMSASSVDLKYNASNPNVDVDIAYIFYPEQNKIYKSQSQNNAFLKISFLRAKIRPVAFSLKSSDICTDYLTEFEICAKTDIKTEITLVHKEKNETKDLCKPGGFMMFEYSGNDSKFIEFTIKQISKGPESFHLERFEVFGYVTDQIQRIVSKPSSTPFPRKKLLMK